MTNECGEEIRVSCEHRLTRLESQVEEIRTNDLAHLSADVKKIEKILWWTLTTAGGLLATLVGKLVYEVVKGHIKI